MWVLVVVYVTAVHGLPNPKSAAFQEFTTVERCYAAMQYIVEVTKPAERPQMRCVEK